MQHSIIEIMSEGKKLCTYKGFLEIRSEKGEPVHIPFSDIHAIVVTAHQVVYTNSLLSKLCDEKIPLIILDKTFHPNGMFLPLVGQNKQTEIQNIQISISKPLKKRLWQSIVQQKIHNQELVLLLHKKDNILNGLSQKVLSDDSSNIEALSARKYFTALFGKRFIRDRDKEGINAFLNYGYSVLRAGISRYIVCAGLNPSYSIKHYNMLNPFCLSDDLVEVFRPLVDDIVYTMLVEENLEELGAMHKARITALLTTVYATHEGSSPLYAIMQEFVRSIVRSFRKGENVILDTSTAFIR